MSAARVIAFGPNLYLFRPGVARPESFPVAAAGAVARPSRGLSPGSVPSGLKSAIAQLGSATEVASTPPELARTLSSVCGRPVRPATSEEFRAARPAVPLPAPPEEREYLRTLAARDLAAALRSPEELLVTLAREEERLERAVGREERASEAMVAVPDSPLVEYRARWAATREALGRHHRALEATVELHAREVVPNLSAVVGARVAARLVAAAGGLAALGRMRGARIQLLGSRRRPSAERGPRFGAIFRAERMGDVPPDRRAAYARSLAALAAIAVRADATTRSPIGALLARRRDRRIEQLRRRAR